MLPDCGVDVNSCVYSHHDGMYPGLKTKTLTSLNCLCRHLATTTRQITSEYALEKSGPRLAVFTRRRIKLIFHIHPVKNQLQMYLGPETLKPIRGKTLQNIGIGREFQKKTSVV